MAGSTKDRRRTNRTKVPQRSDHPILTREYNYVLQISADELRLLSRYEEVLAQGAAQFAQVYYNYLFDNPATADVLYAFERGGGNIGDLVRSQLAHLLTLLKGPTGEDWAAHLENIGAHHHTHGVRPVWMLGGYRLFLDHLHALVDGDTNIPATDREQIKPTLMKLVMRDFGMLSEAFWQTGADKLAVERDELRAEQALMNDLMSGIPQMLWSVEVDDNRLLYISPALTAFSDGQMEAPIPTLDGIHADDQETVLNAWQVALQGQRAHVEARQCTAAGARWFRFQFSPVTNRRGRVLRVHGMLEDVQDTRLSRERIEHYSTTDELTQLANRTLWYDRLATALAACRRNPGSQLAVMVLDINQFKMYNDTLGHQVGDDLLRELAGRLSAAVRDSDTLARLDGDEFGVILPMVHSADRAAERVARQLLGCFDCPFSFQDRELCLSGAIGIAVYPEHGDDVQNLLSHADSAMHRAKRSGEPFLFYESSVDANPKEQLQFSGQLHSALERNEFELHYQPKIQVDNQQVCGAEALLRWQHPQEGLVLPQRFLPLAEQLGMITNITNWVLVTALQQCRQWASDGVHLPIAVNVSARSFQSPGLVDKVRWALQEAQVDGSCLEIEITEETLMADLERGADVLRALSDLNVAVAIDDFGTGYSSLAYLKRLPIQTLKIDRSFLSDVPKSEQDAAIVRSIIDLGHNLGCKVVAEGVENAASWNMLQELGCDEVQGYHISRPLPQAGFDHWLHAAEWGNA